MDDVKRVDEPLADEQPQVVPNDAPETLAESPAEPEVVSESVAVFDTIAGHVRVGSETATNPVHIEDLAALFPELNPEQIIRHVADMVRADDYSDIKLVTSSSGATYLYSDRFLTQEQAIERAVAGETKSKIVDLIRQESKASAKLTSLDALGALAPGMEPLQVRELVTTLQSEEPYKDIAEIASPTGQAYLYSREHMTETYARLLARVEGKDPCSTIAETVREESRIYPRPTRVGLFYAPIFQIDASQMETVVENTLRRPEFKDIAKIVASTGAIYLYSMEYMSAPQAEQWVQWEEVDKYKSP